MKRLLEGHKRFRAEVWPEQRARYESLALDGQAPHTLIVSCSDSRVDPQTVFGAGPGELFVVRNVAGLVPPYQPDAGYHGTSAALEYGVNILKVERIVVLGHARCGGVQAALRGAPDGARDFVAPWMRIAEEVVAQTPRSLPEEHAQTHAEQAVVKLTLRNLRSFPWIAERERAGDLHLDACRFDVKTGVLERLRGEVFEPFSE
jgi:carbonic anhydrase